MDDTKIKLNLDTFDVQFSQKQKEAPKVVEKKETKTEKTSYLKPDRTRMIHIVLNKIRLQPIDIVEALEAYNEPLLTTPTCELILPLMPTESETAELSKVQTPLEEMATADQLILLLAGCVGAKERIKALLFKDSYEKDFELIMKEIKRFHKVFKFIQEDEKLRKWLEIILAIGNYMNGPSARGGAWAFKLDALTKLNDVKSKDNRQTLMHYIVDFIANKLQQPELFEVEKTLKKFTKLQYQSIVESAKEMTMRFQDVTKLKKALEENKDQLQPDDQSSEFLQSFYEKGEQVIKKINDEVNKIDIQFKCIVKLFGEDPKFTIDNFINIFMKFYNDMKNAREWLEEMKKKKSKEGKKKRK